MKSIDEKSKSMKIPQTTVKAIVEGQTILSVSPDETIRNVARQMPRSHSSAAVVIDENGGLMGIVTENDIVEDAVAKGLDLDAAKVSEIMSDNPITVEASAGLQDALKALVDNNIRTVPVLEKNACIGILDIRDLYAGLQKLMDEQIELDQDIIAYAFGETYGGR